MRSSVTPPEISIFARPPDRRTASQISCVDMLSTRIVSAPAARASSTCASVSASTSIVRPGGSAPFPVAFPDDDLHGGVERAKALERDIEAGDHAVGLGDERAAGPDDRRNRGVGRHVAPAAQDTSQIFL